MVVVGTHLGRHRSVTSQLREHGLRLAPQRKVIAEVLQRAGERIAAPEVLWRTQKLIPRLHLVTVYRVQESFKKLRIIDELDLMHVNGPGHYEVRTAKDHTHFTRRRCGGLLEIQTSLFERLKGRIEGHHGLTNRVARLELGGLCGDCAAKADNRQTIST